MGILAEFLKEEAEKQRLHADVAKVIRDDWVRAVNGLVDQMTTWLEEANQAQLLEIELPWTEKREERIGRYTTRGIKIRLGTREVEISPVARFTVGAPSNVLFLPDAKLKGRVDITDGETRVLLYRIEQTQGERWVMVDRQGALKPFDQDSFERAIKDLLQ